jgi:hypothetical protein
MSGKNDLDQMGSLVLVPERLARYWFDVANDLRAENERLKAEVDRLTDVGDAMAMMVGHIEVKGDAHRMMLEFSKEWNAAKEGNTLE